MPAIKVKPSTRAKARDFWGDAQKGASFKRMIDFKFGTYFGAVKTALETLQLNRRLYNMYITGEREIPDDLWLKLRRLPKQKKPAILPKNSPRLVHGRKSAPATLYIDDIDPLS